MNMNIPLLMLLAYMVGTTAIGMLYARQNKTSGQYLVAERSLPIYLVIALLFSEIVAGAGTVGNAAVSFRSGLSSVWANWGMSFGCIAFVFLSLKFFRSLGSVRGVMSVPEAYAHMFDQRSRIVMLLNVVVVYFLLYSTQALAASSILLPMIKLIPGAENLTWLTRDSIAWIITAAFILITVLGGMKGIAKMNLVHAIVMYLGLLIVAVVTVRYVGGVNVLRAELPETYFSLAQPNIATAFAQGFGTAIGFLASANVASATFASSSIKTAQRGVFVAGLLVFPFALFPALIGMCAKIALPEIQPNAALFVMANHISSFWGGLVSMAIIAAIWSTGTALLLVICTTMTRDLYRPFLRPNASDREAVLFSKLIVIIAGILGTWFGLNSGAILAQMLGAFQIRSVVGLTLVVAIFWPRVTKDAAFYSMLIGGVLAAVWHFADSPLGVAPMWPGIIATLGILVVVTLVQGKEPSEGYLGYRDALKKLPAEEERHMKKLLSPKPATPVEEGAS